MKTHSLGGVGNGGGEDKYLPCRLGMEKQTEVPVRGVIDREIKSFALFFWYRVMRYVAVWRFQSN